MIKINVILNNILWKKYLKNPHRFIEKKIELINQQNKSYKKNILTCSLLLSGTTEIKNLNKKFRKKNKSTDVLSFPLDKKIKISKNTYLGDMIISYNYLDKPRSQDLKSFKKKVTKIFIHGFLHLLGFDHKKNKDYSKMLKEENLLYKSVQSKIN